MALAEIQPRQKKLLDALFRDYREAPFAIWTPVWKWSSRPGVEPAFTLLFRDSQAVEALLHNPNEVSLGEAFIRGDIEIEGDLFSALSMAEYVFAKPLSLTSSTMNRVRRVFDGALNAIMQDRCSRRRDLAAIAYHYDRPPQFFRPWLGRTMVYSCAYFRDHSDNLDVAQINKLDLICRKVDLHPQDRLLDIGCGWGSLAMHAASHYGARVRGITLSREQARFAARQISQSRLGNTCFIEMRDYRDLPKLPYRYSKMASVGMFEHVGLRNLKRYFHIAYELLEPGGLFLNHGIARSPNSAPRKDSFIATYVFPGGELVPLHQAIECAELAGFEVRDVENLREHYAHTLRLWVAQLQANALLALEHVTETTYRIWLLYMAGCALSFQRGDINVNQILLQRRQQNAAAHVSTRERWYKNWMNLDSSKEIRKAV